MLNATGVIVHTNLGRAPLAAAARAAVARAARRLLEPRVDLATGARGSRHDHVEALLRELTGAEAAMAVNNCAAAVLLAAAALAGPGARDRRLARPARRDRRRLPRPRRDRPGGRRGSSRSAPPTARAAPTTSARSAPAPARSCARTRRTSASSASSQEVEIEELCELGVPVIDDVGSGNLAEDLAALADEPPVRRSVAAGAALVCFSGDKLLGGPQAGLIVGHARAVAAAERTRSPARCGSTSSRSPRSRRRCASTATPARAREIPVLAMLTPTTPTLRARRARLADGIGEVVEVDRARSAAARCRCSSCPGRSSRSPAPPTSSPRACARPSRPSSGASQDGRLLLDPRTLADDEIDLVRAALG